MIQYSNSGEEMEIREHPKNGAYSKSMMCRKNFFKSKGVLIALFLFMIGLASVIFSSCKTDDDNSKKYKTCDDIKSETSLFTTLNLKVTDNRLNDYNYTKVEVNYCNYNTISIGWDDDGQYNPEKAIYDIVEGTERVNKSFLVAEAEGKNPTLKFKDVPDEYLINILKKTNLYGGLNDLFAREEYLESSIKISNENARVALGTVSVGGNLSIGTDDGVFNTSSVTGAIKASFGDIASGGWDHSGVFVYCNTDCDITGKTNSGGMIDLHLKKGWNMIFGVYCNGDNFSSDEKVITIGTGDVEFYLPAG